MRSTWPLLQFRSFRRAKCPRGLRQSCKTSPLPLRPYVWALAATGCLGRTHCQTIRRGKDLNGLAKASESSSASEASHESPIAESVGTDVPERSQRDQPPNFQEAHAPEGIGNGRIERNIEETKEKNHEGAAMRGRGSAERVPQCLCWRRHFACGNRAGPLNFCRGRRREGSGFCGNRWRRFSIRTRRARYPPVPTATTQAARFTSLATPFLTTVMVIRRDSVLQAPGHLRLHAGGAVPVSLLAAILVGAG